jgi:hypothetical protein
VELGVALAGVGAVLVVGFGAACFQWGVWKTRTTVFRIAEERERSAMDVLAQPAPRGDDLLDRL